MLTKRVTKYYRIALCKAFYNDYNKSQEEFCITAVESTDLCKAKKWAKRVKKHSTFIKWLSDWCICEFSIGTETEGETLC